MGVIIFWTVSIYVRQKIIFHNVLVDSDRTQSFDGYLIEASSLMNYKQHTRAKSWFYFASSDRWTWSSRRNISNTVLLASLNDDHMYNCSVEHLRRRICWRKLLWNSEHNAWPVNLQQITQWSLSGTTILSECCLLFRWTREINSHPKWRVFFWLSLVDQLSSCTVSPLQILINRSIFSHTFYLCKAFAHKEILQ